MQQEGQFDPGHFKHFTPEQGDRIGLFFHILLSNMPLHDVQATTHVKATDRMEKPHSTKQDGIKVRKHWSRVAPRALVRACKTGCFYCFVFPPFVSQSCAAKCADKTRAAVANEFLEPSKEHFHRAYAKTFSEMLCAEPTLEDWRMVTVTFLNKKFPKRPDGSAIQNAFKWQSRTASNQILTLSEMQINNIAYATTWQFACALLQCGGASPASENP